MRLIDADTLKGEKFYSHERHENCVSVYAIDTMPTIEPDRPHGEWGKKTEGLPHLVNIVWYVCSECGVQKSEETPFCPWCGASMKKEGE